MAFVYRCPFCTCEHRGEHPDIGRKTQCRQCEYAFKIPPPAAADMIAEARPRQHDRKAMWLWVGALGFVGLLGGGLFGLYQHRYGWESKHRNELFQWSADAEDALAHGDQRQAYAGFAKVAALGRGQTHLSDDLKDLLARADKEDAELSKIYGPASTSTAPATAPAVAITTTRQPPATVAASIPATAPTTDAALTPAIAPAPLGSNLSPEQIVSRYSRSVALIKSPVGSGTGFVVGPKLILTNYHVIADSPLSQLKVYFPASDARDVATTPTGLLYADSKRDLAVLSADTTLPSLTPAPNYTFKAGQSVVVIGNPGVGQELILENAVSAGIMSTKLLIEGYDYFQMSIAINPGNSGGPVFDNTGAVVGVATLKANRQEGIAFAVPAEDIVKAISAAGRATPADIAKVSGKHNLIAVCRRVSMMSGVYLVVMAMYVDAMREAGPLGVAKALADAKAQVQTKLNKANAEAMADVEAMVVAFESDKTLPQATRTEITEEWNMYLEVKNDADNPRAPVGPYAAALLKHGERRKSAVTALQKALNVDNLLDED